MSDGVRAMWMRGGTSKGLYLLADDLPPDRDQFLLRAMGSPDLRQIDGVGGGDPLTSKVAIVRRSQRPGVDVDYLFLQVAVDTAQVSDAQNCGNILAGVAPFAIERGLVTAAGPETCVTIYMENTGQIATARVQTPDGAPEYRGDTGIDGVPGTAAAIPLTFQDTEGSVCGALLPSGQVADVVDGVAVTMIDNGMPVVIVAASDMGATGLETRDALDANAELKSRLESLRLACGQRMTLGDVTDKTVPKMTLVAAPVDGGALTTRTFIPHRCHASIGVLGAVSVATACLLPGSVAHRCATVPDGRPKTLHIEHPSGRTGVMATLTDDGQVQDAAVLRTARKLFDGYVFD